MQDLQERANFAAPDDAAPAVAQVHAPTHMDAAARATAANIDLRPLGLIAPLALSACGGGGGGEPAPVLVNAAGLAGSSTSEPAKASGLSARDASRFLTQATFGIRSLDEVTQLSADGIEHWLWQQFNAPVALHTSYLDVRRGKDAKTGQPNRAEEHHSYEAIWRQWLFDDAGQLRARVAFALSQIVVISNVAPDIAPYAMSSYMDLLNRNAFGNFRTLLGEVARHPAMGYYLNMLQSAKEDPDSGAHPNENFAREVMQLFSIGLVKLNDNGSLALDGQGKPVPTYTEAVVKGFARAFSGWSFGGQNPDSGQKMDDLFDGSDYNAEANWTTPMRAYAAFHESGTKQLLDGVVLPAGQSPEKDLNDALDNIFQHPNVPPFICRQLIQRLVTSNPTQPHPADPSRNYLSDVVDVFKDNGQGVRGDLRAVVRAILLHPEARGDDALSRADYGKLREPVIRFANYLRAFDVKPKDANGGSNLWFLFSDEMPLGQHPLLAPSVFNFYSPSFRPSGPIAQRGLVAPEFQITNEATLVSTYNLFHELMASGEYSHELNLDFASWRALARQPEKLADRMDATLFCHQMSTETRARLITLLKAQAAREDANEWGDRNVINVAFLLAAMSPDFVIQK